MPVLVWFVAIAPLTDLFAARAEALAQRRILYHRMADRVASLPALQAEAAAGSPAGSPASAVLSNETDAMAGASLQQRLQEMAAGVGAVLSSTETLPATPMKGYRRIGLRVSLTAPWPVLVGLFEAVEQASPRMLIDDLQMHGRVMLVQPAEPLLDAGFTVLAFRADHLAPPDQTR